MQTIAGWQKVTAMALRIEDYALIGDCQTAALVGRDGSIDWLCWPRFDSGACFAALLGTPDNGRWKIAPAAREARVERRYRADTLILETDFHTSEGSVTVIDFMPVRESVSDLVRLVIGRKGRVTMHMELALRFDYGAAMPWVSRLADGALRAIAGPAMTVLRTPAPLQGHAMKTVAEFKVEAGQSVPFVLTYSPSHLAPPPAIDGAAALTATETFWRGWSGRCTLAAEWSEDVRRSLITLKALTYEPTGGIVAAPTTSLPEKAGGVRNWDYRYCWLRDATLTLLALMNANYYEEAQAWRGWLQRTIAGSPAQMQIMYSIAGERQLPEFTLDWLAGYEGSRPVRVGNAAAVQLQLDVYGEVMDALHQARNGGIPADREAWQMQRALATHLEGIWREPDQGMWEVRGGSRHFTYSKVMAWVAIDRAISDMETYGLPGPLVRWRRLRARIHRDVCKNGFHAKRNSFVQSYDSDFLDASLLLIPLTGFLPPEDPRVRGTVAAIERDLTVDGLVLRYHTEETADGMPPGEGRFLACSFWLADNFVLQGRLEEARTMFERLLATRNDVGLLSEEYDPKAKRMLGNFPQAFSHVALVNTALNLTQAAKPVRQRASSEAEPQAAGATAARAQDSAVPSAPQAGERTARDH